MKKLIGAVLFLGLCLAPVAQAGGDPALNVPTLGDAGLVALGTALLGTGLAVLRRKKY